MLAHSPKVKQGIPAQEYSSHIMGVAARSNLAAFKMGKYGLKDGETLQYVVNIAAEYHDLGKLDVENQVILSGEKHTGSLPIQHTDAGTAYLLNIGCSLSAAIVRSHHIGLPDFVQESNRGEMAFRDSGFYEHVNFNLSQLIDLHRKEIPETSIIPEIQGIKGNTSLFFRLALSCLADGDHTDTALHYHDYPAEENLIPLKAAKRLQSLDAYVAGLARPDNRSVMRNEVYCQCRDLEIIGSISCCDSPVGTGKTTAIMAHLLKQAENRGLRRIFVVLPFTNIITQSVAIYRDSLVLPGENPEAVVAELHHRADYQDVNTRKFTALWNAPIIVTTAVSFFETLASCFPSTLRRLHNLPGSAIFLDESHAALPARLLPLTWSWIKDYAVEWGCYWTLASGSLERFWKIKEFDPVGFDVPELITKELGLGLSRYENSRVSYLYKPETMTPEDIVEWIIKKPGPRLVILNTVQNAAVVANCLSNNQGQNKVLHMSTALCPIDRQKTLNLIINRLKNPNDLDWTLVATSCVEAGVDLSFRTGFREVASLTSLLQTGGRVNRHGLYPYSEVWSIKLREGGMINNHPGIKDSVSVLEDLLQSGKIISPALCTDALKREVRMGAGIRDSLERAERSMKFPEVLELYNVINADTRTVVVNTGLIDRLMNNDPVSWTEIQQYSVQIYSDKLSALNIPEFRNYPDLFYWTHDYDPFLGYMKGIIKIKELFTIDFGII